MENMNNFVRGSSCSDSMNVPECQQKAFLYNLTTINHNMTEAEELGFSKLEAALNSFKPIEDLDELEALELFTENDPTANLQQSSQCHLEGQYDKANNVDATAENQQGNQFVDTGSNDLDQRFDMEEFLHSDTNERDNSQLQSGITDDMDAQFDMAEFLRFETKKQDEKQTRTSHHKMKRQRTTFTGDQILELEKEFQLNHRIDRLRRIRISESLNLSERQIRTWFQNRRTKEKKEQKRSNATDIPDERAVIPRPPMAPTTPYQTMANLDPVCHSARYASMPRYMPYGFVRGNYYDGNSFG